ncbi:MAG: dynamin family protein, partial [Pseudomonadota bacterium]
MTIDHDPDDQLPRGGGYDDLASLWAELDDLEASVAELASPALSFLEDPISRVFEKIKAFEPSVSVIGQIKAGKSTLLNAMIGQPDLLPSDVNPWTSVITALHVNPRHRPRDTRALFRFFDAEEWDRLVATGGRLGEMADRVGFENEADEIKSQVNKMRRTTEERFGDVFEALLGNSHAFPTIDKQTIDRYICYGDPDETGDGGTEGVFADITKLADLYIERPDLPRGICLRDTPGVNDTFMMREQITLNAISDSRVCIVVLSAHQALSTMDLALLRIICAVDAREVLIFVNRIDELIDPAGEEEKIRTSIRSTLAGLGISDQIDIVFGSGYWANYAHGLLSGATMRPMYPRSLAALAQLEPAEDLENPSVLARVALENSGIYALHRAIAERICEGPGKAILADVRAEIAAIAEMSKTVVETAQAAQSGGEAAPSGAAQLSGAAARALVDAVRDDTLERFDAAA